MVTDFLYSFDDPCRVTGYDSVRFHILGHYAACTHHTVFTDGDTGKDGGAGSYPCPAADVYGFAGDDHPVVKVMIVRYQLHVGGNLRIVINGDAAGRHHQASVHDNDAPSYLYLMGTHYGDGSVDAAPFSHIGKQPVKQFIILFCHRHCMVQSKRQLRLFFSQSQFCFALVCTVYPDFFHDILRFACKDTDLLRNILCFEVQR